MYSKVPVANRGENAVRPFRVAHGLGAALVAGFPFDDPDPVHRLKAEESYQVGQEGHPFRRHWPVDEIAICPGYPSANPGLAASGQAAGVAVVGPSAKELELTGNMPRAIALARAGAAVFLNPQDNSRLGSVLERERGTD